jgi:hypothetical protein
MFPGPAAVVYDRPILSSERMLHDSTASVAKKKKKSLVVIIKGLGAKTN